MLANEGTRDQNTEVRGDDSLPSDHSATPASFEIRRRICKACNCEIHQTLCSYHCPFDAEYDRTGNVIIRVYRLTFLYEELETDTRTTHPKGETTPLQPQKGA